uniref:DUF4371 domain-containing protein n=1 Tax=Romanomermis culicivorax TaxID=13658 RepID=A0A915HLV2_ROMCU
KDAQYNGQFYGTLLELENECDATTIAHKVNLWITEIGIKKEALVMFTSDGAAVMLERFNGVAEKLRKEYGYFHLLDFHCICHRENLALKDAY